MKNLGWFDKFLFFLNSLFAAVLLLSYLLPYIAPSSFALVSVLSLAVPLLIIINLVFFIFWLVRLKRQFLLSFIVLAIGFNHLTSVYEVSNVGEQDREGDLKIMSYNVKQFNRFQWSEEPDMPGRILEFMKEEDPDILGIQEYYKGEISVAENFPYKYVKYKEDKSYFGQAILSKYPIINSGSLNFPTRSNNNAIYSDIVVGEDTLRVINMHLQSYSLKPDVNNLEKEQSKRVFLGMGRTFVRQEEQMRIILENMEETSHKIIVLGDMNNTAYSYIYREFTAAGLNDAFKKKGNGFGRTFDFDYFPLRIDYIFTDERIEVTAFETSEKPFSDHFAIKAKIRL